MENMPIADQSTVIKQSKDIIHQLILSENVFNN